MARPCSVCESPDRASIEIGLANGVALRVLKLRHGLGDDALGRHRSKHMDAELLARLKLRGVRSDEELAHIRDVEGKSILDNFATQRARLYRNADRSFEIKDYAGERAAIAEASKVTERIGKLLGELGVAKQSITAHDCPRITAEFLAEERASMGDWRFRQEYMCEFVDTDEQFFSSELIDAMADNELEVWA